MKTRWITLVAAAMLTAGIAGCAAPKTTGYTVGAELDEAGNLQEVLQVDNAKIARRLQVKSVKVGQTKSGLMKANVRLASRMNKTFTAQSKFAWFDEEGVEIDPDADPWRPLVIHGKETKTIRGVAPNAKGSSFYLRVRQGERSHWIVD